MLDPTVDCTENHRHKPKAYSVLSEVAEHMDLIDPWQCKFPEVRFYSWKRIKDVKLVGSRIDFALTTIGIANKISSIGYQTGYKTDHAMIVVKLILSSEQRGPGYWKFNNKLLYDQAYVMKCNNIIESADNKYSSVNSSAQRLELCRNELTQWTKKYARKKVNAEKEKMIILKKKLKEMDDNLHKNQSEITLLHRQAIIEQNREYCRKANRKCCV